MKFTYHNRRNPCPICNSTSSKCRTTQDELVLCMTYADGNGDNRDYKFLKPSKDGLWGIHLHKSQDNFDPKLAEQRRETLRKRREEEARKERELLGKSLPLNRRSSEFRQLLLSLKLEEDHRQNLRDRGLTEKQIQNSLFRTVVSGQVVQAHPSLPGIKDGKIGFGQEGDRGFLCPAFNAIGQITGVQIRLDNSENGRYRWLKGRFSSHLPNGELPITVVIPKGEKMVVSPTEAIAIPESLQGIIAIEGILKPYIAAHRFGYAAIGASGGNFSSSPTQLKAELAALSERLGTKEILFPVDAEGKSNKQVYQRDRATAQRLQSWGYEVKVGNWGQWEDKRQPDFDELFDLAGVQWVAADEYFEVEGRRIAFAESNQPDKERAGFLKWLQKRLNFGNGKGAKKKVERKAKGKWLDYKPDTLPTPQLVNLLPKIYFDEGDRDKLWVELKKKGWLDIYQFILDSSWMGSGKSHGTALLPLEKAIYYDINHRNVSTSSVAENFVDLFPRSQHGFKHNDRGELVQAQYGDEVVIGGNCYHGDLFKSLSNKGYGFHDDKENPLCAGCQKAGWCKSQEEGYKRSRQRVLSQDKIRMAPQSAPNPGDYKYENYTAIAEEVSRNLNVTIKTVSERWDKILAELSRFKVKGFAHLIEPVEEAIAQQVFGDQGRWGVSHEQIGFPSKTTDVNVLADLEALEKLIEKEHIAQCENLLDQNEVDKNELDRFTQKEKKQFKGAMKSANAYFEKEAREEAVRKIKEFPANLALLLIEAYYHDIGAVRINRDMVSVTRYDNRFANILKSHKNVILLDATPHIKRICAQ
ncbi:MAG: hypothetical protein AB4290_07520, partial [Spirulina sp.]